MVIIVLLVVLLFKRNRSSTHHHTTETKVDTELCDRVYDKGIAFDAPEPPPRQIWNDHNCYLWPIEVLRCAANAPDKQTYKSCGERRLP